MAAIIAARSTGGRCSITATYANRRVNVKTIVAGRESPYALYQPSYATFGKDNVYNQKDAEGFIRLYGLASRIAAGLNAERTDVSTV